MDATDKIIDILSRYQQSVELREDELILCRNIYPVAPAMKKSSNE